MGTIKNTKQIFSHLDESDVKSAVVILGSVRAILENSGQAKHEIDRHETDTVITFELNDYELEVVIDENDGINAMYYDGASGSYELIGTESCAAALESENLFDMFKYKIEEILNEKR